MAKTLDQIAEMARAYFAAKEAHYKAHCERPDTFDYENEDHIRAKIKSDRLCSVVVSTGEAYRVACDEFFAKACPDLIELLDDINEHFEGYVDIDNNGGPNFAMRVRTQLEAFIDPAPETQAVIEKREAARVLPFSGSF